MNFNYTDALFAVGTDFVSLVALALVRAFGVDAMTVLAEIGVGGAFVDVATVIRHSNLSEAFGTNAHERTDEILASEFAVVCRSGALVHVFLKTNTNKNEF